MGITYRVAMQLQSQRNAGLRQKQTRAAGPKCVRVKTVHIVAQSASTAYAGFVNTAAQVRNTSLSQTRQLCTRVSAIVLLLAGDLPRVVYNPTLAFASPNLSSCSPPPIPINGSKASPQLVRSRGSPEQLSDRVGEDGCFRLYSRPLP